MAECIRARRFLQYLTQRIEAAAQVQTGGVHLGVVMFVSLIAGGCLKHYWTQPGGSLEKFTVDHRECMAAHSYPVANKPGYGVVHEYDFRRCLIARGWSREYKSALAVPPGYFRGYEEHEPGMTKLDALPDQPSSE